MALLLQIPLGLTLVENELKELFQEGFDPSDCQAVINQLRTPESRRYILENPDWLKQAEQILELSRHHGVRWVAWGDPLYPIQWQHLSEPPPIFSFLGEPCWLGRDLMAVVGSRTPSTDSLLWMQRELAPFLRNSKVAVVSGGARGIDQWAHRLCIDVGQPTVCILPCGVLNPYPMACEAVWSKILASGGCLVSTWGLHQPMRKHFFEIRNRWIAGFSELCLVVEANQRSGSLITARLANLENRDVCTIPVSVMANQGRGNLKLLMEGAIMVRDRWDLRALWDQYHPQSNPSRL